MTLLDRTIVRLLPAVPKPVVKLFSSPYIAGGTLDDAVRCVRKLNRDGKMATVDVLGEEITREDEAHAITDAYIHVFEAIEREGLDSNVSVKPTALGLELSYDLCRENLEALLREAARNDNFVRIDMEDSSTTSDTLRMYRDLREGGFDNVGVVLQAYLRRTLDDVRGLADLEPNVRLCKGIYVEPPSIAYADYDAVRANYVRCLDALLEANAYVGVATHDEWLIGEALKRVSGRRVEEYEFQMLLGVREQRATELVRDGHRLRVYVPFGEHWYEYSLRRLQENPAMAGTIARATVGRMLGRP
ncbi:MAG: proline dehydrogenase [Gaiellaceae bacterium]|nr:proline dehydrogenase [Gaiellaceae bacterium]